jgi:hypothetical protein
MNFALQLVRASWTGMTKAPVTGLAANRLLDATVNFCADGEVDVECDGELTGSIFFELELKRRNSKHGSRLFKVIQHTEWMSKSALTNAEMES